MPLGPPIDFRGALRRSVAAEASVMRGPTGMSSIKCISHVNEGILAELPGVLDSSDLRRGRTGIKSRGLNLLYLPGEVAVHKVRHEPEVENLPRRDVADGGEKNNQDAADQGAAQGDLPGEDIVAIAADAEIDQQERRHHHGIADHHAVAGAKSIARRSSAHTQLKNHSTGVNRSETAAYSSRPFLEVRLSFRHPRI